MTRKPREQHVEDPAIEEQRRDIGGIDSEEASESESRQIELCRDPLCQQFRLIAVDAVTAEHEEKLDAQKTCAERHGRPRGPELGIPPGGMVPGELGHAGPGVNRSVEKQHEECGNAAQRVDAGETV